MTIGITQRVELCKDYHEIRDCLDQEWTNLLCKANIDFILVPNSLDDIDSWLEKKNLEGFILTGGNDLSHLPDAKNPAPSRDETEKKILKWSVKNKTKVLGVCRGMQLINCFFSGSLCKVNGHAGFNHSIDILNDKYNFNSQSIVNSYHNWGISKTDLSPNLLPLAIAGDGTIEALEHKQLPWVGIMWHPEREVTNDYNNIQLIKTLFLT
tara:strand:+ start:3076 stop:3705 length:630 start_codon:yes stop_codon:yes gene_type:complete